MLYLSNSSTKLLVVKLLSPFVQTKVETFERMNNFLDITLNELLKFRPIFVFDVLCQFPKRPEVAEVERSLS